MIGLIPEEMSRAVDGCLLCVWGGKLEPVEQDPCSVVSVAVPYVLLTSCLPCKQAQTAKQYSHKACGSSVHWGRLQSRSSGSVQALRWPLPPRAARGDLVGPGGTSKLFGQGSTGPSFDKISGVGVIVIRHSRTLAPALSCQLGVSGRGRTRLSPRGSGSLSSKPEVDSVHQAVQEKDLPHLLM